MVKVITYGTYDLLHYGHIRLLERAKALGDYLIVGVTADDFDKRRGKINVQQSLIERIEAVRATGLADEIIVEEYEGQKIDDIQRYDIDIFTVGTDWVGKFDYLKEYCEVVYLERTEGISSSELRNENRFLKVGLVGNSRYLNRVAAESMFVNGVTLAGICTDDISKMSEEVQNLPCVTKDFDKILDVSGAVYIHSFPQMHYSQVKKALKRGCHVMCESPLALTRAECRELYEIAGKNHCVLLDVLRTAYSTAYQRLRLLLKSGEIGQVVSVEATCTSLRGMVELGSKDFDIWWGSTTAWGPTALLPVFQILGENYKKKEIVTRILSTGNPYDDFTKIDFVYPNATASIMVGTGVKSEGDLVVSGTKGYVYVPAPWWKTDYFEIRHENPADNRKYFYQLEGEGIRYEFASFAKAIERNQVNRYIEENISEAICGVMEDFTTKRDVIFIQ